MQKQLPKIWVTTTWLALVAVGGFAQGITEPREPSPAAKVEQTLGISTIMVNYSRPSVRGRAIWGSLVPYGWNVQPGYGAENSAPWRAGANENTVITFSHNAKVEGQLVPAGSYGLFFTINKDNTGEVILSKDYKHWGSFWYDPKQDQMRANIQLRDIAPTEMLTYDFANSTKNSVELDLNWEKKQFPVKIEYDVDAIVLANAAEELKNATGFTWQGFASAADYALRNNTGYDQALGWANRAVAQNKNFTTLRIQAGLLHATGKAAQSDSVMNQALGYASEIELNNYGYQLLTDKRQDKAIEVFVLNTKRHPQSANVWDSLGEGYALSGDKQNAIPCFKKALSLNPQDNVRVNSEKYLKQLGAM
jgi:tetratricopeptide (TPR) repeat protein